ncbi:MAG: transglycosylase SLT domain-containing protein [Oxalobacteraceae bacterium]|nr:transglycosylase SLT domain-containing protein [Oxalobacteraceae bacterium]
MNSRHKLAALVGVEKRFQQLGSISSTLAAKAHNALTILGLASMAAMTLMFFRPELTDRIKVLSPFWNEYTFENDVREFTFTDSSNFQRDPVNATLSTGTSQSATASEKEQALVTSWLAKRYRIAQSASKMLVEAAYASAQEVKLDPLLVLSVMAIESRFNPFAESSVGAQGLMQVMAKVHQSKFYDHGGTKSVLNPVANIQVGAQILKDLIRRSGSVEAGLKLYVGAGNLDSDGGYAAKVMAEYGRLQAVASGKRVPTFTPTTPAQDTDGLREAKAQEDNVPTRLHQDEPA